MMIIKRVSETYGLITDELIMAGGVTGIENDRIKELTANLVVGVKNKLADEDDNIDVIIRGVESVIQLSWGVKDVSTVWRITTYIMMLGHSLCTQEDVLIDVQKGRI